MRSRRLLHATLPIVVAALGARLASAQPAQPPGAPTSTPPTTTAAAPPAPPPATPPATPPSPTTPASATPAPAPPAAVPAPASSAPPAVASSARVQPGLPPPITAANAPPGVAGDACSTRTDCMSGLACVEFVCRPPPPADPDSVTTIAGLIELAPGLAGRLRNGSLGVTLGADIGVQVSQHTRYHVSGGITSAGGYYGFYLQPFILGFPFRVGQVKAGRFYVEPCANLFEAEGLINDGTNLLMSAGGWVSAVFRAKNGLTVSFAPVGVQARFASVFGNSRDVSFTTGPGVNWLMRLSVGL